MATLQSIDDLKNYCLRRLGSPVINIEVDTSQVYDRIEDAIAYFAERHFDGTEEVYFHHTITNSDVSNGYITMPKEYVALLNILSSTNQSTGEPQFDYQYRFMLDLNDRTIRSGGSSMSDYYIAMSHIQTIKTMLSVEKSFSYNSVTNNLQPRWPINDVGSTNLLKNPTDITTSDWTSANASTIHLDGTVADPLGKNNADTVTSLAAGNFSISQTYTTQTYIRGTYTTAFSIKNNNYVGNITVTIKDAVGTVVHSEILPANTLWNKNHILFTYTSAHAGDISVMIEGTATAAGESFSIYNPWLYLNNTMVFHGYKIIDPTQSLNIYNERWVKDYSTNLIKRQWGSNLKKFEGVQMPGGVTLNGQAIFDEATTEIDKLMEVFTNNYEEQPVGGYF